MDKNKLNRLLQNADIFLEIFDAIRVVDPVRKRVFHFNSNGLEEEAGSRCFDFWKNGAICENCVAARALKSRSSCIKVDTGDDKAYMLMAIPIEDDGRGLVVELFKNITGDVFVENISDTGSHARKLIGRFNLAVVRDSLTHVFNKGYIDERLPSDIAACLDNNEPISIIMADIDEFKMINDQYGHLAGDTVIKTFAQTLTRNSRNRTDWVARFGGDEFIICLNQADSDTARAIAERIKDQVENLSIPFEDQAVKITVSIGIATLSKANKGADAEKLVKFADHNLYLAKKSGRNRVVAGVLDTCEKGQ